MAKLYTCEICKKTDTATEDDEVWYNLKGKHFSVLPTLCWSCAMEKCCYCFMDGTWYQKYEMCICDNCYSQKIKKKCIKLGCNSSSSANGGGCKDCGEYFCEKHMSDDRCGHCLKLNSKY